MILSVYEISHGEWMTTQRLYVTWYQCICVIKPAWLMTTHSMYIWNHTHCMYDTIGTLYDITSTLADNTPLFVCHGTHSVYDILYIIYDVTRTVCMTTLGLYLTWNLLKLTSLSLYMSSHTLCWRHYTCSVRHHRRHMYAIICIIEDIIFTLYDNLYYLWQCYITEWPCLWHQSLYIYDIFTWYGIRHSVMTTKPLCAFPATMPDITLNVYLTLQTMYQFFEKKWMYVITASIYMTPYALHMTSHPLFMTSHHCSCHITSTELMTSHIQYMTKHIWQYKRYICHLSLYI